jgi:hypothetical protein
LEYIWNSMRPFPRGIRDERLVRGDDHSAASLADTD